MAQDKVKEEVLSEKEVEMVIEDFDDIEADRIMFNAHGGF